MLCPRCAVHVEDECPQCHWTPPASPSPQSAHSSFDPSKGPYLSKEECGLDFLYAIGRCASLRQIRKHIQLSRGRLQGRVTHPDRHRWQRELAEDLKTEKEVVRELVNALVKLSIEDHAFIMDRYQDVMTGKPSQLT